MFELKLWDKKGNIDGFILRKSDEELKREFIREYRENIEEFYEEYYNYNSTERYIHRHF